MFHRAGRIVDIFRPKDTSSGKSRGFAFVRLASCREAEKAIVSIGKSWGGRKIQVNMARYLDNAKVRASKDRRRPLREPLTGHNGGEVGNAWSRRTEERGNTRWIVEEGSEKGVRVAPWVVAAEIKPLYCSLVGGWRGPGAVCTRQLGEHVVLMQISSEEEATQMLRLALQKLTGSPFRVVERRKE